MRALIRSRIVADTDLIALGFTGPNVFAVDVDTPPQRPFMQLRWSINNPGIAQVTRRTLVVWVHDKPGDYTRIDNTLIRLRALLPSLAGQSNGLGNVVDIEWIGDSEDLTDDGHRTITRTASFTIVGSGQ